MGASFKIHQATFKRTQLSRVDSGSNYLAQSSFEVGFGLGSATVVDELRVEWPDGSTTVLAGIAADQRITVTASGSWTSCESTAGSHGEGSRRGAGRGSHR